MKLRRFGLLRSLALAGCMATSAGAAEDQASPPDDALLEFLGGFETADGEWVDPMTLAGLETEDKKTAGRDVNEDKVHGDEDDES